MRVDIETVIRLHEELNKIKAVKLEDIEFYKNNELIKVDSRVIEEFRFTGLNNVLFIVDEIYERKNSMWEE